MKLFQLAKQHGMSSTEVIGLFPPSANLSYLSDVGHGFAQSLFEMLHWHRNLGRRLKEFDAKNNGYKKLVTQYEICDPNKFYAEFHGKMTAPEKLWLFSALAPRREVYDFCRKLYDANYVPLETPRGNIEVMIENELARTTDPELSPDMQHVACIHHALLSILTEDEYWTYVILFYDFVDELDVAPINDALIHEVIKPWQIQTRLSTVTC